MQVKRIRLERVAYAEGHAFSLTLATQGRRQVFLDAQMVDVCCKELRVAATRYRTSVYAYCFMPDHLHLLVAAPAGVSLLGFVRHFKQLTAYRFRRLPEHWGEALWQPRYYHHALRQEEQIDTVARYIWGNPVRAGFAADLGSYRHWGSLVWDRKAVSGSEDPDLRISCGEGGGQYVGEGLQTLAKRR